MKISDFARANGISVRTLRYYDEIGLLQPSHVDEDTGYRHYDASCAARLASIRFYQLLGFPLEETARLTDMAPEALLDAMSAQRQRLVAQRDRLDRLIRLLEPQAKHAAPGPSLTSLLSAYARGFHAAADDPVFADGHVLALISPDEQERIRRHVLDGSSFLLPDLPPLGEAERLRRLLNSQFVPATVARSRFCEDRLQTALCTGTQQVVILGAGLDTLAWRMPGVTVYEVDHPTTQADKLRRIRESGLPESENVVYVPLDLTLDDLPQRLREAGFDPSRITFFTLLGVSWYLPLPALTELLAAMAALSVRGSAILMDYADEGFLTDPVRRVQNLIAMAEAAGEPVQSCLSDAALTALMAHHGFQVYELLPWRAVQERYFASRTDGLCAFEHMGCALCVFNP